MNYKNLAWSTVAVAPSPALSGTTMTLAAGEGADMPAVPFKMTICPTGARPRKTNAEVVLVTAITGDAITAMTRAQGGTNARAIIVGDETWNGPMAEDLAAVDSTASPSWVGALFSGLTASRLVATDGLKALASVALLSAFVLGTANQVVSTNDGAGGVVLSLPQNIHAAATPIFAGLTLNGASGNTLVVNTSGLVHDATTGNTGFGTASPGLGANLGASYGRVLDVQDSANKIALSYVKSSSAGNAAAAYFGQENDTGQQLFFGTYGSANAGAAIFGVARPKNSFMFTGGVAGGGAIAIGTGTATDLTFGTNLTARMTIKSGGTVGIGVTTTGTYGGIVSQMELKHGSSHTTFAITAGATNVLASLALNSSAGHKWGISSYNSFGAGPADRMAIQNATYATEVGTWLQGGQFGIGNTNPAAWLHLRAGTATAGQAPIAFTSGPLLTVPVAGRVEFLTDAWYGTITTGAVRKTFAFLESPTFVTPVLGVATGTSYQGIVGNVTPAAGSFTTLGTTGLTTFGAAARLKGYTVAALPAGTQGDTAFVTDALAPAYLTAVVGGGAIVTPVFHNGAAWVTA